MITLFPILILFQQFTRVNLIYYSDIQFTWVVLKKPANVNRLNKAVIEERHFVFHTES